MKIETNIVRIRKPTNKIDKFFSKFKKVLYKVTKPFGDSISGEIREAHLITKEGRNTALLYHPKGKKSRYDCASFEICIMEDGRYWTSQNMDAWINVDDFNV